MAGPAGIRRRPFVPRDPGGASLGPPAPTRCPHCGFEVLNLAVHLAEDHPDQPQQETEAERAAREQEAARQAAVAAEIARREAEAAQRKAEARARRQAVEGPQAGGAWPGRTVGASSPPTRRPPGGLERPADSTPTAPPTASATAPGGGAEGRGAEAERKQISPAAEAWARLRRAMAERTVLTGAIRSRRPFGVIVDLGGIEGLVRSHEMHAEGTGRESPGLRDGESVPVVVIGMNDTTHRVELSMRRAGDPRTPSKPPDAPRAVTRPAEGPMALAFRLARAKKQPAE
jgi:hypothetical protein